MNNLSPSGVPTAGRTTPYPWYSKHLCLNPVDGRGCMRVWQWLTLGAGVVGAIYFWRRR